MSCYTCGLRYFHATNLHIIHIWTGKFALIQGELLGRETDTQSSESTQASQRQDAFGSNIFICDSGLQSFMLRDSGRVLSQIFIFTDLSVQENEFMGVPICPRRKLHISQHCSILHAACRNYKGRIQNKSQTH